MNADETMIGILWCVANFFTSGIGMLMVAVSSFFSCRLYTCGTITAAGAKFDFGAGSTDTNAVLLPNSSPTGFEMRGAFPRSCIKCARPSPCMRLAVAAEVQEVPVMGSIEGVGTIWSTHVVKGSRLFCRFGLGRSFSVSSGTVSECSGDCLSSSAITPSRSSSSKTAGSISSSSPSLSCL